MKQLRIQIAEQWLSSNNEDLENEYSGFLGQAYKAIIDSRIKQEPLNTSEESLINEIKKQLYANVQTDTYLRTLLVLMLYCYPEELQIKYEFSKIPTWFINEYLKFILDPQRIFSKPGEAETYYDHIHNFMNELHHFICENKTASLANDIARKFLDLCNFIPLYFTDRNLKDVYVKRADIVEFILKQNNHQLDYDFSDRKRNNPKIRIGILASHFSPAAETFASLPIYEYLSREFEVILYSLSKTNTPLEQYCKLCANSFKQLPNKLEEQVQVIRSDDLDILWVGTNVTAYVNQIFLLSLHRMARIQMTSVASVVTTGIRNIDYYISGELTDHLETAQEHYKEKLIKLEGTAHCFSYGPELPQVRTTVDRQSLGIGSDRVIFISGANFFKIIPDLIETWAKIIAGVPNSVLVLMPFGPNWSNTYPKKSFIKQLNHYFTQHGIQTERLVVLDPNPTPNRDDVKEYFKIADIYLDSYPFSGTTSLMEPLQVGLPIVSRRGSSFRSSMGVAILQSLNIPDLVTLTSEKSYIDLAVALGTNSELRQQISNQIQKKMQAHPRFLDTRAYSLQMGLVFKQLFQNHLIDRLKENIRLGDINFIIFPDWSQPEETVGLELQAVIKTLVNHPDKAEMTLLIDNSNITPEEADLVLSSVAMNLLMEEEIEFDGGPEIVLIGELSPMQWSALMSKLQGRIKLDHENQEVINNLKADIIPVVEPDNN
ncbi:methyltransferase type 11 [Arthrospira sp. O9.13F]|nr:methyltransferase type 11 [Arthrospira sp. O9.13F]